MPTADKRACNTTRGYDEKGKRQRRTGGAEKGLIFLEWGKTRLARVISPLQTGLERRGWWRMNRRAPGEGKGGTQLKRRHGRARRDRGSKSNAPTTIFRIDMCIVYVYTNIDDVRWPWGRAGQAC